MHVTTADININKYNTP